MRSIIHYVSYVVKLRIEHGFLNDFFLVKNPNILGRKVKDLSNRHIKGIYCD